MLNMRFYTVIFAYFRGVYTRTRGIPRGFFAVNCAEFSLISAQSRGPFLPGSTSCIHSTSPLYSTSFIHSTSPLYSTSCIHSTSPLYSTSPCHSPYSISYYTSEAQRPITSGIGRHKKKIVLKKKLREECCCVYIQ